MNSLDHKIYMIGVKKGECFMPITGEPDLSSITDATRVEALKECRLDFDAMMSDWCAHQHDYSYPIPAGFREWAWGNTGRDAVSLSEEIKAQMFTRWLNGIELFWVGVEAKFNDDAYNIVRGFRDLE